VTTGRRDDGGTPFGRWLREHPDLDARTSDLSATDSDMWVHKFRLRDERGAKVAIDHLMLIEVKCFQAQVPFSQADTLNVIDLVLRMATIKNGHRRQVQVPDRRTGRTSVKRSVRWLGLHVLQLSGDRPDNSDEITWDGKYVISKTELVELLKFDRDPDHPKRFLNTRRHHLRPIRERHADLFIIRKKER